MRKEEKEDVNKQNSERSEYSRIVNPSTKKQRAKFMDGNFQVLQI